MENKYKLSIVIAAASIAAAAGIYVLKNKEPAAITGTDTSQNEEMKTLQDQAIAEQDIKFNPIKNTNDGTAKTPSEEPDKEKFNEYFSEAYLAKISNEDKSNPFKAVRTESFSAEDQFCTSLKINKTIPANRLSWSIYDVDAKKDMEPQNTVPVEIAPENGFGCTKLTYPAGRYEQRIYIDNVLVTTLPFGIK
jgi:hypothetical protein